MQISTLSMKVKLSKPLEFTPISLTITFETQEEYNRFAALHCWPRTPLALKSYEIRKALGDIEVTNLTEFRLVKSEYLNVLE